MRVLMFRSKQNREPGKWFLSIPTFVEMLILLKEIHHILLSTVPPQTQIKTNRFTHYPHPYPQVKTMASSP